MTSEGDHGREEFAPQSDDMARDVERLERRLVDTERQRDRLGALLVGSEQHLAAALARLQPEMERATRLDKDLARSRADLARLTEAADELARVRATKSWRVTKPLRLIRSRFPTRHRP